MRRDVILMTLIALALVAIMVFMNTQTAHGLFVWTCSGKSSLKVCVIDLKIS